MYSNVESSFLKLILASRKPSGCGWFSRQPEKDSFVLSVFLFFGFRVPRSDQASRELLAEKIHLRKRANSARTARNKSSLGCSRVTMKVKASRWIMWMQ